MVRRLVVWITLLIATVLLVEGVSWLVFRVAFAEPFSYRRLGELRQLRIAAADGANQRVANPEMDPALTVPHPYLGFVYDPRYDPAGTMASHSVPVNDFGFLDTSLPLRRRNDHEVVIGVFGGSVAFWLSVHGIEALFQELANVPRFRGKQFVVVRIALGGFKQPQQLMALNYLLALGAHFDVVVNLDGFNEIALAPRSNVPRGIFPFYPRGWPELLGQSGDPRFMRLVGRVLYLEQLAGERAQHFSGPLLRRSVFASTLWRILDLRLEGSLARAREQLEDHRPQVPAEHRGYSAVGPGRAYADDSEMYDDLTAVWSQSSLQMQRLCTTSGIVYFHFLQPNQYLEGTKPMTRAEQRSAILPGNPFRLHVAAGYPRLREAGAKLAAQGVPFTDMTRAFAGIDELLYIDTCCHFNEKGNEILGRAMGKAMAKVMARSKSMPR